MEVAFERATWRTLKGVFSLWASTNSRRNFASQALPSPLLRTNYLRPQRRKFPSTLREGEYAVLPAHEVPEIIRRPAYATAVDGRPLPPGTTGDLARDCLVDSDPPGWSIDPAGEVQSPEALQRMRKVCRLAATALKIAIDASKPGVTTEAIDAAVHRFLVSQGAYPAAINFFGFPKSVCASVNEGKLVGFHVPLCAVACHGVPSLRPLREGDVVSYDCTAYLNGFFGDCAGTTVIRPASQEHEKLVAAAKECLNVAIRAVKPGVPIARIGEVITEFARAEGFSVVSEFCGHFIGRRLHLPPLVPHGFPNDAKHVFSVGQTFTIEPILCEGSGDVRCWEDGWTTVTQDCGRCAQFEHTLVVTEDGAEPLTCAED
ncbi:hypothetical protein Efla_004358 [Eimeria flavescens]